MSSDRQSYDPCRIQKVRYDPDRMSTVEQIEFVRNLGMSYEPNCELRRDDQLWAGHMLRRNRINQFGRPSRINQFSGGQGSGQGAWYWIALRTMNLHANGSMGDINARRVDEINTRRDQWTIIVKVSSSSLTDEKGRPMVQFEDGYIYCADHTSEIVKTVHATHIRSMFSWMKSFKCLMNIQTSVDVDYNPVVFM